MKVLRWLRSGRIATQITALVFVSGVVALGVTTFLVVRLPEEMAPAPLQRSAARVGALVQAMERLPPAGRAALAAAYGAGDITIDLAPAVGPSSPPGQAGSHALAPLFARELPRGAKVERIVDDPGNRLTLAIGLPDGADVLIHVQLEASPPSPLPLLPPVVFLVAVVVALSVWAAFRMVAPLARFAAAVEKFGLGGQGEPLPEEGPAEIRRATGAFNRMRERILRLIEDRTQMMMAISHDLRTPLTRLRLRTEDIDDPDLKRGMLRDIELMESSISDAVSNLRDVTAQEARQRTDLPSLLETICGEFADAGFSVEYEGPRNLDAHLRPQAATRAVTNLVQNATKFASRVVVRLSAPESATAQIDVEDDGPGIPDEEKEAVLKPFYRSDPARQQAGGFGLGLAIALEIARDHGGTLTLHDRSPRGLCARLRLPLHLADRD